MTPGEEIAIHIDQTLTHGPDRARTDVSVQYVDPRLAEEEE